MHFYHYLFAIRSECKIQMNTLAHRSNNSKTTAYIGPDCVSWCYIFSVTYIIYMPMCINTLRKLNKNNIHHETKLSVVIESLTLSVALFAWIKWNQKKQRHVSAPNNASHEYLLKEWKKSLRKVKKIFTSFSQSVRIVMIIRANTWVMRAHVIPSHRPYNNCIY